MSLPWRHFGLLPPRASSSALRLLGLMLFLISYAVEPASAQLTPTPELQSYRGSSQTQPYRGAFADLAIEIDAFWESTFEQDDVPYASPNIVVVEQQTATGCGVVRPEPNAFYCGPDRTIYLVPQFLVDQAQEFGDYAPIAILSHEWGHHIQTLLGIIGPTRKAFELQADCLMGAFTRHADEQGLLDYGDFLEVLSSAIDAGDEVFLPENFPGAHGMAEDRVKELTKGYGGGPVTGCNLEIRSSSSDTSRESTEVDEQSGQDSENILPPSVSPTLLRTLPLNHSSCFDIVDEGTLSFEQLLGRFSGVQDAPTRLQGWGWQASAFRQFGCDGPPEGEAGWIDISTHLFGNPIAAQEAVDYFAAVRATGSLLVSTTPPSVGDHAVALSGPAVNGKEFTIYVSQGPLLVRVTGVSPSGIPFGNVLAVTQAVLAAQQISAQTVEVRQQSEPMLPASAYLPVVPFVRHRECFEVLTQGTYTYGDEEDALSQTGLTAAEFNELGWQDGAYIVFTCDDPPIGRAAQIDIGIHQFQDSASAEQALSYYLGMFELGENESRSCDTALTLVICVSGRSTSGSPLSDVQFVLNQVVDGAQ